MKDKNESCVELNIYVECDKCSKSEPIVSCPDDKHDDNESCVKINISWVNPYFSKNNYQKTI